MSLSDAQRADVRRFAGYPLSGTTQPVDDDNDTVYLRFGLTQMSLHKRLSTLSVVEETVLTTYLTQLALLESALIGAGDNLDTASAAVWTRNPDEVADRAGLFDRWRHALCEFLGLPPGPALRAGGCRVTRG